MESVCLTLFLSWTPSYRIFALSGPSTALHFLASGQLVCRPKGGEDEAAGGMLVLGWDNGILRQAYRPRAAGRENSSSNNSSSNSNSQTNG